MPHPDLKPPLPCATCWPGALRRRPRLRAREWLSRSPSRPIHPGWLRCSSVTYLQYAPSSRLAIRAPRPRSSTDLAIRGPLALDQRAEHAEATGHENQVEYAHQLQVVGQLAERGAIEELARRRYRGQE